MSFIDELRRLHREADGTSVSRPELERLQAQRRKAVIAHELTPGGAKPAEAQQSRQREDRIEHIQARLIAERGHAVTDFAIGQQRGVAKDGFERSR